MRGAPPAYQTAIDYLYRFVEHTGHARWAGYERAPQRTQAFLARLGHPEMTFPSANALVAQIKKDVERTRQLLTPEAPRPECQER